MAFFLAFYPQHHRTEAEQQEGGWFWNLINKAFGRKSQGKSAKRAAIHNQNPKKIKKFSPFLTLYPTTTYLFSVSSVANVFFDQTRIFAPL
jgi:hypothetical protein